MDVGIHSTIFRPVDPAQPYLVVVSAIPIEEPRIARRSAIKRATAGTLAEAARKCDELAAALREILRFHGDSVQRLHCPWNPGCQTCFEA